MTCTPLLRNSGGIALSESGRVRTSTVVLSAIVIALSTLVLSQWTGLQRFLLTRRATPEEIQLLLVRGREANPFSYLDDPYPRMTGRLLRWAKEPTLAGVWTTWYGESSIPRSRAEYAVDGSQFLGETSWQPNGKISFQLDADGRPRYEPPWLFGAEDHPVDARDLRGNYLAGDVNFLAMKPLALDGWTAPDLRADPCVLVTVSFRKANLSRTKFDHSRIEDTEFGEANLTGASFLGATLTKTRFVDSDLRETCWNGATIAESDFTGADLAGATFEGTEIRHVDFRGCRNLTREQFVNAELGEKVLLPEF